MTVAQAEGQGLLADEPDRSRDLVWLTPEYAKKLSREILKEAGYRVSMIEKDQVILESLDDTPRPYRPVSVRPAEIAADLERPTP